jgi:hypothetical protein
MKRKFLNNLSHSLVNNYVIQTESIEGVDHIIVPVIMMVEGVHNGSRGPILYTEEELSETASTWNNYPVVVNHPTNNKGGFISAEGLDESQIVGTIQNSRMENNKLKADLRINPTNLQPISPETLQAINDNTPLDVSIGVFSDDEVVDGEFNNEQYRAIAHNLKPDHLALLPNESGACSWDDGCGIRNNKLNESKTKTKNDDVVERNKLTVKQMHSLLLKRGFAINELNGFELTQNELGFSDINQGIQQKLDAFDGENKYHYLVEAFQNGSFVYHVRNNETRNSKLYRRSYQVNNGQIELLDDAVEVIREVNYPVVAPNSNKFTRTKKKVMNNEKVAPCKVNALIENKASNFTEDDREFLEGLDEPTFNKLLPEVKKEKEKVIDNSSSKSEVNHEEIAATAVKSFFNNIKSSDDFIDLMPEELKNQTKEGLKMYNDRRTTIIKEIAANSEFSEEALKDWSMGNLETMHKSVVAEEEKLSDYSLNGEADLGTDTVPGKALQSMLRLNTKESK